MRTSLRWARDRSIFFLGFATLLLGVAQARLLHLQVIRARDPADSAIYRAFDVEESGRRGDVRDARGGLLATTVREVDVRVWTDGVGASRRRDDRRILADRLGELCGIDPATTLAKLAVPRSWTLLAKGIRDPWVVAELRALSGTPGLRAVTLETRYVREYPRGPLLAPLLGFVGWQPCERAPDDPLFEPDGELRGVAGIEALCDDALLPASGRRRVRRDGLQRELHDPDLHGEAVRDGCDVELTIEPVAQALAERALDVATAEFEPDWAQLVVLDPASGDVLAVAQRPAPASPKPASQDAVRLHEFMPVQRTYPPGSSFKPLMLGLVFERGLATPDSIVDCDSGACAFGRRVIHDVHPKAELTATEVLVESSNIGMAKLVLSLVPEAARKGDPAFRPVLEQLRSLGFAAPTYGFAGEAAALLPRLRSMSRNYSLASLSFGQEISVTAIQMATACATLANGGTWQPARFVRAATAPDGASVELDRAPPSRRVFSARTAADLRRMLERVVDEGGARRWKPAGWSVAGKTGTAEDERNAKTPVASYWCFGPVHDPRFLVLAVLYHPKRGRFAADNAAKVAAPLLGELLERFEVPRDRPEELAVPDGRMLLLRAVGEGG